MAIVESDNIDASCQVLDFLSDHRYVIISRHLVKNSVSFKKKQFRDIKNVNKELLRTRCSNIFIDETCDNISSIATKFDEDLIQILGDFAPGKIKVIKDRPLKPWILEEIIQVRKDYRKCVKVWSQSHTNTDWSSIKRARNAYGSLLKKKKKLYYSSKVLREQRQYKKTIQHHKWTCEEREN